MKAITYTAARENFASVMRSVCEDHAPLIITRGRNEAVVMMALGDYESLKETAYLLRSPKNAKRLRAAVEQLRGGKGTKRELPQVVEAPAKSRPYRTRPHRMGVRTGINLDNVQELLAQIEGEGRR